MVMSDAPSPASPTAEPAKQLPLVFDEPRGRKKPPRHLADLTPAERKTLVTEMGLPGFRAKQLSGGSRALRLTRHSTRAG